MTADILAPALKVVYALKDAFDDEDTRTSTSTTDPKGERP